jgi:hypothetical protein
MYISHDRTTVNESGIENKKPGQLPGFCLAIDSLQVSIDNRSTADTQDCDARRE